MSLVQKHLKVHQIYHQTALVKKDDSLQNSSQTAVQNVNKDGDKSPNTGLGAGAALTMLLLGAVAVSVSKRTKDK
ncbi:MAG: NPXTG-anchored protein [Ruminococcus sp.]